MSEGVEIRHLRFVFGRQLKELVAELEAADAEIERLRAEMKEQSRIIGMSGEREARHLAEIERLTKKHDAEFANGFRMSAEIEVLEEGRDRLHAEIEQLKEDVHLANGVADLAIKHRDAAEAEIERLREENDQAVSDSQALEQEAHQLYNVLAVIHRDGGHYAHEHGAIKASEDAINEVIKLRSEIERLKAERNEIIEMCAKVCEMLDLDIYDADMCADAIRALKEER